MTTDNRTNEPTPEQVEAAAKAMWDLRKRESEPEWGELEHGVKQEYRKDARAALVAAASAAPVKPSSTVDEAALAEVIAKAGMDYNLSDRSAESYLCGAPDYRSVFLARAIAEHLTGGAK